MPSALSAEQTKRQGMCLRLSVTGRGRRFNATPSGGGRPEGRGAVEAHAREWGGPARAREASGGKRGRLPRAERRGAGVRVARRCLQSVAGPPPLAAAAETGNRFFLQGPFPWCAGSPLGEGALSPKGHVGMSGDTVLSPVLPAGT